MARIYELRQKEVINTRTGQRLGFISDIDIDVKTGKIVKIIVPGPGKIFGIFGREQEYQIQWCDIKKIGGDIVLIDVDENDILNDIGQ